MSIPPGDLPGAAYQNGIGLETGQVPLPVPTGTFLKLADASASASGIAPLAPGFSEGMTLDVRPNLNRAMLNLDLLARYGGGGCGIVAGLGISAGTGLTLLVSPGHALADGVVEMAATTSVVLPDNTDNVYVWLLQTGTLVAVGDNIDPPEPTAVYLGAARTSAGAITGLDFAGIVRLVGGVQMRDVADVGAPADSPDSSIRIFTRTATGLYFWDGDDHEQLGQIGAAYDIAGFIDDTPAASQVVVRFVAPRNIRLPKDLTGSVGKASIGATGETDFDIKVNGASVGTMRFAASAATANFIFAADVDLVPLDVLTVVAPATPDATLAGIGFTLAGRLIN